MREDLPIACDLSGAERQQREAAIRTEVAALAEVIVEREDSIEVKFPGGRNCLVRLAELVALERECCRFLRFELAAEAGGGAVRLRISGPSGTGEFLRSWFFPPVESEGVVTSDPRRGPDAQADRASALGGGHQPEVGPADESDNDASRPGAVRALGEMALRVTDLAGMKHFYQKVLGLEPLKETGSGVLLRIGQGYGGHTQVLGLFDRETPVGPERTTLDHIAFTIAPEDYEAERNRLENEFGLDVEARMHHWAGWRSLYFRDPEGNLVELVCSDPAFR